MAQEQITIDFNVSQAEAYKEDGMRRALLSAESKNPDWAAQALDMLRRFIASHSDPFMVEDVRAFAYREGLPHPDRDQAWGAIVVRAAKMGIIVNVGVAVAKDPTRHRGYTALWQRRINQ